MVFFAALMVGATICGLPYLVYGAEFPPWQVTMLALALASGGLAVMRPADKWPAAVGVGAGILVPIIVTIVVDYQRDPTSHNLAPFEILIGLAVAMPPALLGALAGGLAGRVRFRRSVVGGAIAGLGIGIAAAHAPIMLAQTVASETAAKAKMKSLIAAQHRFRSANPDRGFSCDLDELGERFDAPAQRYASAWPVKGVYGVYGAGAQAPMGDYGVSMLCGREPHPKTSFLLFAGPTQEGLGRWVYCAEADGRLRKARRRRNNFCLKEGAPAD